MISSGPQKSSKLDEKTKAELFGTTDELDVEETALEDDKKPMKVSSETETSEERNDDGDDNNNDETVIVPSRKPGWIS